MDSQQQQISGTETPAVSPKVAGPVSPTAMAVRLWACGGPQRKLRAFAVWGVPNMVDIQAMKPQPSIFDEVDDAAPWMPELQASRKAPPPTTAAPTPAARNRLRRETS